MEIITSPNSKGPSRDWLKFIKSSSAKAKIKQFYKNELKEDNIRIGQARLEEEAKKKGYALSALLTDESFKRISDRYSFGAPEEMYAAVGYGSVSVNQVLFKLIDFYKKEMPKPFEVQRGGRRGQDAGRRPRQRSIGAFGPLCGLLLAGARGQNRRLHLARAGRRHSTAPTARTYRAWMRNDSCPPHGIRKRTTSTVYNANIQIRATDQGAALSVLSLVVSDMKLSITAVNGRIDKNRDAPFWKPPSV